MPGLRNLSAINGNHGEQFLFDPDEVVSLERSKLPDALVGPPQDRPDVMSLLLI